MVDHIIYRQTKGALDANRGFEDAKIAQLVPVRNTMRYLGSRAALATHLGVLETGGNQGPTAGMQLPGNVFERWALSPEMHTFLMDMYRQQIHNAYPVFDWPMEFDTTTTPAEESSNVMRFIRPMVYSIACHCLPGNDTRLVLLSSELYQQAAASADELLYTVSVEALQVTLLLAIRSLFVPGDGSIGQQISFAKSMMMELVVRGLFVHNKLESILRRTLYCLEETLSSVLDRPSQPPDSVSACPVVSSRSTY